MRLPALGRSLWIAGVVLAVLAGFAVLLVRGLLDREPSPTSSEAAASSDAAGSSAGADSAPAFTEDDAARISTALSSGDRQAIAAVLIPEVRDAFLRSGGEVLPSGATAAVQAQGFVASEPTVAKVPLVVTGEGAGTFTLLLAYEEGQWLVFASDQGP